MNPAIDHKIIDQLRNLRENWDDEGGAPLTPEAARVLELIFVVPASDGGFQLEWHAGKWDVEVRIAPDGRVTSFCADEDDSPWATPIAEVRIA